MQHTCVSATLPTLSSEACHLAKHRVLNSGFYVLKATTCIAQGDSNGITSLQHLVLGSAMHVPFRSQQQNIGAAAGTSCLKHKQQQDPAEQPHQGDNFVKLTLTVLNVHNGHNTFVLELSAVIYAALYHTTLSSCLHIQWS